MTVDDCKPSQHFGHSGTYLKVPHKHSVSCAYSLRIWLYKRADSAQVEDFLADSLAYWIGCSPCTQEAEGSSPTEGTCPNDFSDPVDQEIRTQ